MKRIHERMKQVTVWMLLVAMFVIMFPIIGTEPKTAEAASLGSVYINGLGELEVLYSGDDYEICLNENKDLVILGTYYSNSSATLSYHTTTLYFTAEDSNGNPTGVNYRSYNVSNHKIVPGDSVSLDTYIVPRAVWEGFFKELNVESGEKNIYMSEGFRLKKRTSAETENWTVYGQEYNTLTGIMDATDWSDTTKYNFDMYFDVQLDLHIIEYNITVTHDSGGYAFANKETCAAGTDVSVYATPDDGYVFDGWEITSGYFSLKDSSEATTSFTMPNSDVGLHAKFTKSLTPVPTKKPVTEKPTPTPDPNAAPAPTATPAPTTTPIPTPTPAPIIPSVDIDVYDNYTKYYTTDAGYSIQSIYNTGMIAGCNGDASVMSSSYSRVNNTVLKGVNSYTVGTDENGNEWYFIPTTEGATYVHPKTYNGYDVSTTEVQYITELTFPEKLSWEYNTAEVVSIGGGLERYNAETSNSNFSIVKGTFDYTYDSGNVYEEEADYFCIWNTYKHWSYCYGVVGNGEITSSVAKQRDWSQAGEHTYHHWGYSHNHYVYNTTLEYITIPSTVTRIEDYAFYNCQALRKINGATGVTEIGTGAFEGAAVLTTAKSKPGTDENGWSRNTYYYYNGTYSAGTPTSTMTKWAGSVALKEYFELPKFGAVKIIGAYSFQRRKNLFDVTLVSDVSNVQNGAFANCDLNSITVPGKSTVIHGDWTTLGSKGTPAETIIYTEPETKAMHYGLNNDASYITRAGYEITYHNNATPKETYTSKAMVQNIYVEIDTQVDIYENATADYPISPDKTFTLDTDGAIWPVSNLSGIKIKSLHSIGYRVGQSGTYYGQSGSYYNKNETAVAIAENGEVYGYDLTSDTWVNLGIPEGSTNHAWSTNRVLGDFGSSYSNSFQSGGYSNYSIATTQYLYYLDPDGRMCRKKMCYQKEISTYPGYTETSARRSGSFSFLISDTEELPMPSAVGIASFSITEPVIGSTKEATSSSQSDVYYTDKEECSYTLNLATVYAIDENGDSWIGSGSKSESYYYFQWGEYNSYSGSWSGETTEEVSAGYNETEYETGVIPVSGYTWTKQEETFRQVFAAGGVLASYTPYWSSYDYNRNIIDEEGNLLFVANSKIQNPTSLYYPKTTGGNGEVFEVLTGANFVKAEQTEGGYYILTDAEGGVWIYYASGLLRRYTHHYSTYYYVDISTPVKLFDDASVYKVWDAYDYIYTSYDYSSRQEYFYDIVIQDDKGRFWKVSTQKVTSNYYGSDESSYYETWKDVAVSRLDTYEDADTEYLCIGYEYVETLYANMFERDGYRFLCWNTEADGSGKEYMTGSKLCVWEPITIYAQWDEQKNIIRYAPNGGAGYMEEDVYEISVTTATLKQNIFTRAGNEFLGWNTKADGSGTCYTDGGTVRFPKGAKGSILTVYAQWKPFGYTVKVAEDEVRVMPPTFTDIVELSYNEEMTVPAGLTDKAYTVSYDVNGEADATPYWKTMTPFAEEYTKAALTFLGWQLYEETAEGYKYIGFYEPGETFKNKAGHEGATLLLFPYWGGEAAYVKLPVAGCAGYEFLGFTPGEPYVAGTFSTDEQLATAVVENTLVLSPEGSGARYKPTRDETLFAYYVPKENKVRLEVISEQNKVQLLSEEYQTEGGIPSTETVDLLGNVGPFLVSCVLEQRSGIKMVRAYVTATYRTQYTDANGEELIISEPQTATVEVMVPKEWSYWSIVEGGVFVPEKITVKSTGLEEGEMAIPIVADGFVSAEAPSYRITSYDAEEHLLWEKYDADGTPSFTLSVAEELCIVSEVPGELPDVEAYLRQVCSNVAAKDKTQFLVRSDGFSIEGITLLSDEWSAGGQGAEPQDEAVDKLRNVLREAEAVSVEQSGIALAVTAKNGVHTSAAEVIYRAGEQVIGEEREKRVLIDEVNSLLIHTPVVCVVEFTADHETEYQCATVPDGREVLVLDETGACSDFVLQISNYGNHSEKKGYGERSYTKHLARKDGMPRNEVQFPMEVWMDVGNDNRAENDLRLSANVWHTIGTEAQRFYLPFETPEGEYTYEVRSVAANGDGKETFTEETGNRGINNYVAVSSTDVYVTGRLYDFTVYGISGTAAWEEVSDAGLSYTVGDTDTAGEKSWFDTLPLREGAHPYYRNMGGLPMGGSFYFRLKSVGSFFEEGTKLTLVPEVVCVTENGYEAVDVYFEKETENGVFFTRWSREESEMVLWAGEASKADETYGEAVRYWYGTFSLPEEIYAATEGTDVTEYRNRYGLDFTEAFWRTEEILVLRFYIKLENTTGEVLYYGAVPDAIPNTVWRKEAGVSGRVDANGIGYPILGGEVAVLYPGESGRNDYVIHGIY